MHDHPIAWRVRGLVLLAAIRMVLTGRHVYLSTGCLAGRHAYCLSSTGPGGQKKPGRSKFSDAECICWCHDL